MRSAGIAAPALGQGYVSVQVEGEGVRVIDRGQKELETGARVRDTDRGKKELETGAGGGVRGSQRGQRQGQVQGP